MNAANRAWYWVAAGVLALGLNGYYQDGGLRVVHCLANRSRVAVVEAKAQVRQIETLAELTFASREENRAAEQANAEVAGEFPVMRTEAKLAELQKQVACAQAAHMQAQLARMQRLMMLREMKQAQIAIQDGRPEVMTGLGQVRVVLPPMPQMPRVQVSVPQGPSVEVTPN